MLSIRGLELLNLGPIDHPAARPFYVVTHRLGT